MRKTKDILGRAFYLIGFSDRDIIPNVFIGFNNHTEEKGYLKDNIFETKDELPDKDFFLELRKVEEEEQHLQMKERQTDFSRERALWTMERAEIVCQVADERFIAIYLYKTDALTIKKESGEVIYYGTD